MSLYHHANEQLKRTTAALMSEIGHNSQPFEVGKTYRTRDGREAELGHVGPLSITGMLRSTYEGRVIGSPWSWYPNGRWLSGETSGSDLMEECEATL